MPKLTVLAVVLLLIPSALLGQKRPPACAVSLEPLLTVQADRDFIFRSIRLPPPPVRIQLQVMISQGGAASVMRTETPLELPGKRVFAAGTARGSELAALRRAMDQARIGIHSTCLIENDLSGPTGVRILGAVSLTWTGRSGRQNRFSVVYADPGESDLPLCAPETGQLVQAIEQFASVIAAQAPNVKCSSALQ